MRSEAGIRLERHRRLGIVSGSLGRARTCALGAGVVSAGRPHDGAARVLPWQGRLAAAVAGEGASASRPRQDAGAGARASTGRQGPRQSSDGSAGDSWRPRPGGQMIPSFFMRNRRVFGWRPSRWASLATTVDTPPALTQAHVSMCARWTSSSVTLRAPLACPRAACRRPRHIELQRVT